MIERDGIKKERKKKKKIERVYLIKKERIRDRSIGVRKEITKERKYEKIEKIKVLEWMDAKERKKFYRQKTLG